MTRRQIIGGVIGVVVLLVVFGVLLIAVMTSMVNTAVSNAVSSNRVAVEPTAAPRPTSLSESDDIVSAETSSEVVTSVLDLLFEYEDTASAEEALMTRFGFTREQAADFNGGMNHWTSGRGSCGSPDRDPQDPEYCRFRYLVSEDTLVAFVIDATGLYFENRDHVTEFIVTNEQPFSVKDGGLLSLHSTMTEEEVALAVISRLFWANRPGMTRDDAVGTGPTRTLAIRNEMGR